MASSLAITGISMVTPVGYNTAQTCAALRAGIVQFEEFEGIVSCCGEPIVVSQIQNFGSIKQSRLERTKRIGIATCQEALTSLAGQNVYRRPFHLSVLVNESERPGNLLQLDDKLVREIILEAGFPSSTPIQFYPYGNAAGMKALQDAQQRMEYDPSTIEFIWGIDSLLAMKTLAYLEKMERLKGPEQPRGIIPGEASVGLVLQAESMLRSSTSKACRIVGVGVATEKVTVHSEDEPCLGEGLTTAIYTGLEQSGWSKEEVTQVYCDMNGEVYRAHEWMLALCRTLDDPQVTHPADCIGDVGAASAPLLIGMASVALNRGYAKADKIFTFCSSDFGTRGSVCLAVR
jgi:3-oxoacyl-[acyl-carrier-protein] synthase-1